MYKKIFLHSILAGVLSSAAALTYYQVYFFATQADYSRVLNTGSIIGLNMLLCLTAGLLYLAAIKVLKQKGEILFNFLFSIISFACVMIPISVSLPLDILFPELFPGLAVPMVFFPAIAWYTVGPLFRLVK